MRIIQLTDDEKNNQQHSHDIDRQLRNSLIYVSHEQISTYNDLPLVNSGMLLHIKRQYKINKIIPIMII